MKKTFLSQNTLMWSFSSLGWTNHTERWMQLHLMPHDVGSSSKWPFLVKNQNNPKILPKILNFVQTVNAISQGGQFEMIEEEVAWSYYIYMFQKLLNEKCWKFPFFVKNQNNPKILPKILNFIQTVNAICQEGQFEMIE